MNITTRWKTIAITGYNGSVTRDENRSAHGAVCQLQVRKGENGILGRRVNSNGVHHEKGDPFPLDPDQLAHWEMIAKQSMHLRTTR